MACFLCNAIIMILACKQCTVPQTSVSAAEKVNVDKEIFNNKAIINCSQVMNNLEIVIQ